MTFGSTKLSRMLFAGFWLARFSSAAIDEQLPEPGLLGPVTNGPAVFQLHRVAYTNFSQVPPGSPLLPQPVSYYFATNGLFKSYLPGTLNHIIWTNFIAHTNGRSTVVWSERTHPTDWPAHPPIVKWNPKSLIHGWRGFTAISPCWEGEGWSGQVPVTALTRRHGYARGHGMGEDGFSPKNEGKKIWFVTANNELVTVKVRSQIIRIGGSPERRDYTIFVFDRDLPAGIEPMGVASITNVFARYASLQGAPAPFFYTEQGGHVSAQIPGFTVPTWKQGDSGSPDMLPLPGELVFLGGRSTTGPTPGMQADMDDLSRRENLNPKRYQMRWVDLSSYPKLAQIRP
jgi:hypothetical protein